MEGALARLGVKWERLLDRAESVQAMRASMKAERMRVMANESTISVEEIGGSAGLKTGKWAVFASNSDVDAVVKALATSMASRRTLSNPMHTLRVSRVEADKYQVAVYS